MGRFFGVPSVPYPLWRLLGAGGFKFPVVAWAGGPHWWGAGVASGFSLAVPSLAQDRVLLLSGSYLTEL